MPKPVSAQIKNQWKENIIQQRESGLSIASWCRTKKIDVHVFYYWRNKFFPKESLNRSSFTKIPIENKVAPSIQGESKVTIDYQRVRFTLDPKSDTSNLKQLLADLKEFLC